MSIIKVLEQVGAENITYQSLQNSMIRAKHNKKNEDFEVTFATEVDILHSSKVGIVVWVDAVDLSEAVRRVKGE